MVSPKSDHEGDAAVASAVSLRRRTAAAAAVATTAAPPPPPQLPCSSPLRPSDGRTNDLPLASLPTAPPPTRPGAPAHVAEQRKAGFMKLAEKFEMGPAGKAKEAEMGDGLR